MKIKREHKIVRVGLYMLSTSIVILIISLFINSAKTSPVSNVNKEVPETKESSNEGKLSDFWERYTSDKYKISFSYPRLLNKNEFSKTGEYDYFVVFEENQYSLEKGVAFGVSSDGFDKEVERIKSDIEKQGKTKIVKDDELLGLGEKARIIEFDPEESDLEKRSFVIIEKGDYTYSISTTPEQIQTIIDSIKFSD